MSRSYREINQHPSLPWNFITHGFLDPSAFPDPSLEAQQRYLSYRAILVAIVSQNVFVFLFSVVSHNYHSICCKMGYRTDVSVRKKGANGGVLHRFGGVQTFLERYRRYGVSQRYYHSIAIWRDMGPLRLQVLSSISGARVGGTPGTSGQRSQRKV